MKINIYSNKTPEETIKIPIYTRTLPNSIQAQIHDYVNFDKDFAQSQKILIQNSPKEATPSLDNSIEEATTQIVD